MGEERSHDGENDDALSAPLVTPKKSGKGKEKDNLPGAKEDDCEDKRNNPDEDSYGIEFLDDRLDLLLLGGVVAVGQVVAHLQVEKWEGQMQVKVELTSLG